LLLEHSCLLPPACSNHHPKAGKLMVAVPGFKFQVPKDNDTESYADVTTPLERLLTVRQIQGRWILVESYKLNVES